MRERVGDELLHDLEDAEPAAVVVIHRDSAVFVSFAAARPGVLVARILGPSSEDLDFVTRALALAVSHPKVLADDPLRRKY